MHPIRHYLFCFLMLLCMIILGFCMAWRYFANMWLCRIFYFCNSCFGNSTKCKISKWGASWGTLPYTTAPCDNWSQLLHAGANATGQYWSLPTASLPPVQCACTLPSYSVTALHTAPFMDSGWGREEDPFLSPFLSSLGFHNSPHATHVNISYIHYTLKKPVADTFATAIRS